MTGLWGELGLPDAVVTGEETVLPGPFRVAHAASQTIAAATLAAGELLRLKGIEPGTVSVDMRHAAAAFRSERYLRVNGEPPADPWAGLSGDYHAADGWVRLHCNYPHHAEAVCRALGVPDDRDAVASAVAGRNSWDVQEAVLAERGAAAAMRTREQWLRGEQSQALAQAPLVDFSPIAPSPARPLSTSDRPLGAVRVLELTHVIAGPVAGRALAAHGADVLHIGAAHLPVLPTLMMDTGLGKRSAHLDLRTDAGRDRLWRLISEADVFLQSFRPGALAGLGFTPERLAEARPGIVLVELDAYGWSGPWAARRGFDSLVQMASGIAAEGGLDKPRPLPAQALDHATGWLAAAAAMLALRRRTVEGGSWRARLSLARTGLWLDSLGRLEDGGELDVSGLLTETASVYGTLTHVRVPGTLPASNPRWENGSPLPGADPAEFRKCSGNARPKN
ncbi:carnitine dehydratase [Amycolatopsis sp. K13G38]|uniref:Carnitine dehydratase n=1 Tax=Amycolatopsis acididurans TaxID=2724524 RepID=A0ABX1J053_9PSEU|nr:CoA transferase [Amycolatopsis acididurans]NKQ53157.1 carnitine dehydratase [Amycolatopsis acididurans]